MLELIFDHFQLEYSMIFGKVIFWKVTYRIYKSKCSGFWEVWF